MTIAHGRHERRGAEGVGWGSEREYPAPRWGTGLGRIDCQKIFVMLYFKWRIFMQFGIGIFYVERCVKHRHKTVIRTTTPPHIVLTKAYGFQMEFWSVNSLTHSLLRLTS